MNLPSQYECKIAIIGLGYVGLPLAVQFASTSRCLKTDKRLNRKIYGFDINSERINSLKKGVDKTKEISKKELLSVSNLKFTDNADDLIDVDVFIITVPTPIKNNKQPDLSFLESSSKLVAKILKKRKSEFHPVIIYESTVYPGVTEDFCVPILENISSMRLNSSIKNNGFYVGYSPERINPGSTKNKISSIVKVTSGSSEEVSKWIDLLYSSIIEAGTFSAKSIKVAEAAKVIENTQRDLNIALVNELAIIFNYMEIDTYDVLEAAATKWNFLEFFPGLVGGHCIGVDPYYLTYKAESLGYHPQLLLAGRRLNDNMANWIVDKIIIELTKNSISLFEANILILGFSFKENCSDIRNTKIIDIISRLNYFKINSDIVDPVIDLEEAKSKLNLNINGKVPNNKKYDCVFLAVSHNQFSELDKNDWLNLIKPNGIFVDLKNTIPRQLNPKRI